MFRPIRKEDVSRGLFVRIKNIDGHDPAFIDGVVCEGLFLEKGIESFIVARPIVIMIKGVDSPASVIEYCKFNCDSNIGEYLDVSEQGCNLAYSGK